MSFFIDVENAIAQRLRDKLPQCGCVEPTPRVYQSRDLNRIQDKSHGDLSIFVTYNGIVELADIAWNVPNRGTAIHEYIVWVVARSAKAHAGQVGTRELADPVLEAVIRILMGVRLLDGIERLRIAPSQLSPVYDDNGFGYFNLTFQLRRQLIGFD